MSDENNVTWSNIDPKVRKISMIGLALAMLIACFDGTIIGTCGPVIAHELNGTELYAWMITAYMLCETVMIPLSGKMSDHYGRKPLFLIGLGFFVGGSVLGGMSTSMEQLILFRAIQGLGAGTMIPVVIASVGDFYAPANRGKIQGVLGAIFGIGSAIGPLLGGYIAEYTTWRWVFYVNVPLAIIVLGLTIKKFPAAQVDILHKVDYLGMAVLSAFLVDLLLFIEFGGQDIEWVSIESAVMMAIAAALLAIFILIERKVDDPVLAPHLFKNRTVVMCAIFMMIFGIGMMGAMTYSSMFNIYVYGLTTMQAGEISIALVAGMMITSLSSGALLAKTGYKPWLIAGPIITAASLWLMSGLKYGGDVMEMVFCLFILGLGLGCMMSVVMVATQNSARPGEMGMTTSSVNLMRSIGATAGTAIFAMVIAQRISSELFANVPAEMYDKIPHDTGVLDEKSLVQ
ncbi:MAG: DHA2 family efflux MFS transporter permease subunit, partial [Candidatus Methanoplasma sp.]|nr:DHA2 family efflux MFS transporter permease subunit [Candidatus Methanoplasma sp.]